ncbi:MAG: type II/IV secretion system protein [Pseudomonadota bacterium]
MNVLAREPDPGQPAAEPAACHEVQSLLARLSAQGLAPDALERARRVAQKTGDRIDLVLCQLGLLAEDAWLAAWGEELGIEVLDEAELFRLAADIPKTQVRAEFLRGRNAILLAGPVAVLADPLDRETLATLRFVLRQDIRSALAPASAIREVLQRQDRDGDDASAVSGATDELDIERLRDLASDAPVIQWVNSALEAAIGAGASDIHLEPGEQHLAVRMRVDGLLQPLAPPDAEIAHAVISRIKIMARLDIAERRLPQDGRATATARGRRVDLRIATAPTPQGETLVIRLLDTTRGVISLQALGYAPAANADLMRLLGEPNGIILVTGPTGSGKTTTLYAMLRALQSSERKLISIEDPVEYQVPGIAQIQAAPGIGLDFARALRSTLRHDPDVVMVGEIRDLETAEVAVEAALTGHLVLSTLHTNSAAATLTRLREMGLAPYLLASALKGVIAQRLVRRLCPACRELETVPELPAGALGLPAEVQLSGPVGCSECRGTGFRGRLAVNEVMRVGPDLRDLILAEASEAELSKAAVAAGMVPLSDDAARKASAGETTPAEVLRLTGAS